MTAAAIRDKAVILLAEDGWTQCTSYGDDGERCMTCAIYDATEMLGLSIGNGGPFGDLMAALDAAMVGKSFSAIAWNDEPGRAVDDVFALLEGLEL